MMSMLQEREKRITELKERLSTTRENKAREAQQLRDKIELLKAVALPPWRVKKNKKVSSPLVRMRPREAPIHHDHGCHSVKRHHVGPGSRKSHGCFLLDKPPGQIPHIVGECKHLDTEPRSDEQALLDRWFGRCLHGVVERLHLGERPG
ncbi:hypothetical protein HPB52_013119 [Rhipicephalus sanguineus]|uniref:Uncharacterized protein n=1 Tax=Rhipicephalus sanguineus TaxID=34632 RepID=A0A9D4YPX5_RHISA|nr:hypothetical protein HPB52_013119 [Rhipicephalus sanguineus]